MYNNPNNRSTNRQSMFCLVHLKQAGFVRVHAAQDFCQVGASLFIRLQLFDLGDVVPDLIKLPLQWSQVDSSRFLKLTPILKTGAGPRVVERKGLVLTFSMRLSMSDARSANWRWRVSVRLTSCWLARLV